MPDDKEFEEFMQDLKESKEREKNRIESLNPRQALEELVSPLTELYIDDNGFPRGVLKGKDGKLYTKLRGAVLKAEVFDILVRHFIFKLEVLDWGTLLSIQAKTDKDTWDTTACANLTENPEVGYGEPEENPDYDKEMATLQQVFEVLKK